MGRRKLLRNVAAAAVTGALAVVAAMAVLPPGGSPAAATAPRSGMEASQARWVTLITGDRVMVTGSGKDARLSLQPAQRSRPVPFNEFTRRGDRYLVPGDAAELVRADRLDIELFNVTGLLRQGFDDGSTPSVPLLVGYADKRAAARTAAPAGATLRRTLPRLGMTALDARKSTAAQFWNGLARPTGQPGARQFTAGVQNVWLNGRVKASLEQSVPQIGAPAAWGRGLTGAGVTVAVLDTGIDTDHPDLAGKVSASADFTGKGSVEDGFGHGTHVASIVTGSGAASGGKYKGVAPDVRLAIGKVLDDTGSGAFDWVLAGMQWAATESGARVVNMSLGSYPTDGTDPMSQALNTLTEQYGTLFVVSAGNDGRLGEETVGSPGTADAALTVASVDKSDALSDFSSRGPRVGDGAAKPDIAAPGSAIVAARPAGVDPLGTPVGDAYQQLDGTSMSAPHVAGTAALLAQQHTDWKADALKAALISTAAPLEGIGPFAVGTGRVDADRATRQPVTATGSVSAYLRWPNLGQQQKHAVTWRNTGATPVTLNLDLTLTRRDGRPVPAGLVTLSANTVTVPAGATASVDVTATGREGGAGGYGGTLSARSPDGIITTRTTLAIVQETEMYDLTVTATDRDGNPAVDSRVSITDLDNLAGEPSGGRLPRGRYAVHVAIMTPKPGQEPSITLISHPELTLDRNTSLTFDARLGHPVSVSSDNPEARGGYHALTAMSMVRECACVFSTGIIADPRFSETFAATLPGTSSPDFAFAQARRASEPTVELFADDGQRFEVLVGWMPNSPEPTESANLPAVYGGQGTPDELAKIDARGKLVLLELPGSLTYEEKYQRTSNVKQAGGRLAVLKVLEESPAAAAAAAEPVPGLPTLAADGPTAERFAALVKARTATVSYASRPFSKQRYELAYGVERQVTGAQVYRPKTKDLAKVQTAYHANFTGWRRTNNAFAQFFGRFHGVGWTEPIAAPGERTEYFTPGTWWLASGGAGGGRDELVDTLRFEGRRDYRVAWNKAVAGPAFRGTTLTQEGARPWAWRKDDAIDAILPIFSDSQGRARVPEAGDAAFGGDTGSISLYRNGTLVGTEAVPDRARFDVPPDGAAYRLTAEANREGDWWPQSTKVTASWGFRSAAADEGKPLPLLTARFDPAVDLQNRAPGGNQFTFPAYVERQGSDPKVKTFTVEVSYDDGGTWTAARVTRTGDHWTVTVNHPSAGHASLRAKATDTDGNTVEQTVIRAYQIGG